MSTSLADLPLEVLLDNLFPCIPAPDLLKLACCSKFFAVLCADDTLWMRKLRDDFNFSGEGTARTSGWKFIYRGLSKPRVFVWGDRGQGRLGRSHYPKTGISGVPFPIQIQIPGVRVVALAAGGMSFHALDSNGNVHVWGTLNGTRIGSRGYSEPGMIARKPLKLALPSPVRSISCGRLHSSCLDGSNRIWTFTSWGRPFWSSAHHLRNPSDAPLQVECGWAFSSLLTKTGEVFVWWPFAGQLREIIQSKNQELDQQEDNSVVATPEGVIPCVTWGMELPPTRLPPIPRLPTLPDVNERTTELTQIIKIAAFDNGIIGLTNHGHVVKYGSLENEETVSHGQWEYLPYFSELQRLRRHPEFSGEGAVAGKSDLPSKMQITHITANFRHFIAYSAGPSSIVLIGDTETTPDSQPKVIPTLQNKAVISVVIGDYHNAALTLNGKLLTWGAYSNGALGLGDPQKLQPGTPGAWAPQGGGTPPPVETPAEVRFDHGSKKPKDRFCFAATAAGWHTGALVIDLDPEDDDDDEETFEPEQHRPGASGVPRRGGPPFVPPLFRVGHAGRGAFIRGRGG